MYLTNTSIFNILNTLLYNALRQNVSSILSVLKFDMIHIPVVTCVHPWGRKQ